VDATVQFQDRLNGVAKDIEALLDRLLEPDLAAEELGRPPRLREAMRYASLGAGKRFRPFLVVETAALFGVPRAHALMAGAALECVHCYSLVHDDLPAMDNDDLRRGQPTVHKAYDEATAILAGDGLLTEAFAVLASASSIPPDRRADAVAVLAAAAGAAGMVGGQAIDLVAAGRVPDRSASLDGAALEDMHARKTGALIRAAFHCAPRRTQRGTHDLMIPC
jgi:farnesyl diphosphate synthase